MEMGDEQEILANLWDSHFGSAFRLQHKRDASLDLYCFGEARRDHHHQDDAGNEDEAQQGRSVFPELWLPTSP